jgi:hypothetical protein
MQTVGSSCASTFSRIPSITRFDMSRGVSESAEAFRGLSSAPPASSITVQQERLSRLKEEEARAEADSDQTGSGRSGRRLELRKL